MLKKLHELKEFQVVLLLTVTGLIYRVLHFVLFADMLIPSQDATRNIRLGRNLAFGNFYGVLDTYWPPAYPVALGIATWFVDDLVIPAVIVSTVAGTLSVTLTYYLTRQSYGRTAALIAGVITIFVPFLINSVFSLGSESLYLVFVIGALLLGWSSLSRSSALHFLFTGLLVGLAYLTRPEAVGYVFFFTVALVGKAACQGELFRRTTIKQLSALLVGFALLSTPYLVYLRSETGSWTISGKASENFASGVFAEDRPDEPEGRAPEDLPMKDPGPKELAANFIHNSRQAQEVLNRLLPMLLLILATLGLFGSAWSRSRFLREGYLLLFCALTVFGYIASWVVERYFYVLLPIFIGWIAIGIVRLENWFRGSFSEWTRSHLFHRVNREMFFAVCIALVFVYTFTSNFYVRSKNSEWQGRAYEERDAGIWLRENGKPLPLIFSSSFRPVFFAEGQQHWNKPRNLDQALAEIRQVRADYVMDTERSYKGNPFLRKLGEVLRTAPDYELIYERNDHPGYRIAIFARREDERGSAPPEKYP